MPVTVATVQQPDVAFDPLLRGELCGFVVTGERPQAAGGAIKWPDAGDHWQTGEGLGIANNFHRNQPGRVSRFLNLANRAGKGLRDFIA